MESGASGFFFTVASTFHSPLFIHAYLGGIIILPTMHTIRNAIYPGLRGAFFYGAYWGAVGLHEPFIVVYFMRNNLTAEQIGWLAAVLPTCTLVITPLITRLADRTGRRVLLLALTCLIFGAALTLPAWPFFTPTFGAMIGFAALFAIFRSPIAALADSLVASMAARRELDFGSMRLWGSIIFTLAAFSTGGIWARTGFETMFLFSGLGLLPVALAALLLDELPARSEMNQTLAKDEKPRGRFVLDTGILFLLGSTFLVIAALFMAMTFTPILMTQLGGSETMVGWMTGTAALCEVPGMLFGSRIARRLGSTTALLAAYTIITAGLIGFGLSTTPALLILCSGVRGLGFGLLLVGTVTTINTRAPREFTSTYQGILNAACWGLAPLLGGPVSGWVFQNQGPTALFYLSALMSLAAMLLILPTYKIWHTAPKPAALVE